MLLAGLTPLHVDPSSIPFNEPLAGHHSDIYRDEIYCFIAGFV